METLYYFLKIEKDLKLQGKKERQLNNTNGRSCWYRYPTLTKSVVLLKLVRNLYLHRFMSTKPIQSVGDDMKTYTDGIFLVPKKIC